MLRRIIPGVIGKEPEFVTLGPEATAADAARLMRARVVGAVMVVEDERLLGIVTERDLVFKLVATGRPAETTALTEVMTADPETLAPTDNVLDALDKMQAGRYRHLPVVDDGRVCGMVSIRDLFGAARATLEEELHNAEALIHGEQYGAVTL